MWSYQVEKSVLGKYWSPRSYNDNFVHEIARTFNISDFLAKIISRNVTNINEAIDFFNPKLKSLLPDPFHLKDMRQAVERVTRAIQNKEKVCIYADYDVDGATSAALLKNLFSQIGLSTIIYVPDRIAEGYGPTPYGMQEIKKQGANLVITVDCGSVAFEAIEHAVENNLEVIVIDHHISLEIMPKALAVINPNRLDETSRCKNLAAVGVSFLFAVALCKHLKQIDFFNKNNIPFPDLMKQLDLVALGTVCDVMQITGLNRAFVAQGLKIAKNRENIGYKALCDIAAIEEAPNIYHLGFIIGPRINAGGRVGKSDLGARILSTKSEHDAQNIAIELNAYNEERKAIEVFMLESADEMAKMQLNEPVLFIVGNGWHPGVIGIVAGRLKEKYNKPVAVIALNDNVGKASCRSVKNIDFGCKIIEAKQRGLVVSGGGHAMAAGFTVEEHKLDQLKLFLLEEFKKDIKDSNQHLHEHYDLELSNTAANMELIEQINKLEPYGVGNPAPVFKFKNLYVLKADIVGLKHIKILFAPIRDSLSSKPLAAIAFNVIGTDLAAAIMSTKPYNLSIIGKLKVNSWQNKDTVQILLQDIIIEQ
ncbi:MAG: single-stranded-DNA-specific exonuclease RecJ [Rickettsiales bacterium]|nr:MAG: single-stranded-DNA-specific exonuclease RecJ [Rickettsiales bacterium]